MVYATADHDSGSKGKAEKSVNRLDGERTRAQIGRERIYFYGYYCDVFSSWSPPPSLPVSSPLIPSSGPSALCCYTINHLTVF